MKIAVWHNLPSGGGKRALYYHVCGLVERGHSVQAWCPSTSDRNYLPLNQLVTEHVIPIDTGNGKSRPGVLKVGAWQYDLHQSKALDAHCRRCAEEINAGDFDILFANSSVIHAVSSIGRYVKTKKILYLQEPNRWLYEAGEDGLPWIAIPPPIGPWMRPRYIWWFIHNLVGTQRLRVLARDERFNASAFDVILVNSYFSRESLLRVYGLDSRVCYLGVDTKLFVNHRYPRENFVVSVGALGRHKNVELIIEAVSKIAAPRPRLVWIANRGSKLYHQEMCHLAESRDVRFEARWKVSDKELVETLNRAVAMVYAPRLEPFGLAPLEANACGLPVIAVAEGGVRESIIDSVNGLVVQHQPEAIAHAVQLLVQDKNLVTELSEKGSRIVQEKWSVNSAVQRLEWQLTQAAKRETSSNPE